MKIYEITTTNERTYDCNQKENYKFSLFSMVGFCFSFNATAYNNNQQFFVYKF